MRRKLYLPLIILLSAAINTFSQTGEIRGRITEKGGKEGVPFASVAALQGGAQVIATLTDLDGNYTLKPLTPGKYDVKATSVGYSPAQTSGVLVTVDKISFASIELAKGIELKAVEVTEYSVPLIDKGSPSVQKTVSYEEIQAAPLRDVNSIASTAAGAAQEDAGKEINIRGSRSDATAYYVDGIKVRGNSNVATKGAEQITVITGGLPAQYGDATGGIVSITTRGPSKTFSGGIEASSSKFLDSFDNTTLSFDLSGPIYTKRDADGKKSGQPLAGFFLAGDYNYDGEPSPSAIGAYEVKQSILDDVRLHPLIPNPSGNGYIHRSAYFTMDSLNHIKARNNVASRGYTLNGKLDFHLLKNLDFSLGGSYSADSNHSYLRFYSLMDYDANPLILNNTWRAYAKITQRFGGTNEAGKSASVIKGGFYSIQADYSQTNSTQENANHKDKFWDYGYVGQFTTHSARVYQKTATDSLVISPGDTISGNFWTLSPAVLDTEYNYTASDLNPYTSAYTTEYYDLTKDHRDGNWNSFTDVSSGGGLINGDNRNSPSIGSAAYSIWGGTGRIQNFYSKSQINQFSLKASGEVDIKSHTIVVGMEYEQRSDRGYTLSPSSLWTIARQYGRNGNAVNFDLAHPMIDTSSTGQMVYEIGQGLVPVAAGDTLINYNYQWVQSKNVDGDPANGFYENLRQRLGVANNKWVDMDNIKPDFYTQNGHNALDLFVPDELLDNGIVSYYGYDYLGNKVSGLPSISDYYSKKDATNNFIRQWGAFQPVYVAGYIQDRFNLNDLTFNIGLRVDRFDANQKTLADKYLLYPAHTAGDADVKAFAALKNYSIPSNIGSDYVVYTDKIENPGKILGYRNGDVWYDAQGNVTTDVKNNLAFPSATGSIQPWLLDASYVPSNANHQVYQKVDLRSFKDYDPQTTFMPRIAFSFPISDEANFKAHYDILTQRPQDASLMRFNPQDYLYWAEGIGSPGVNPDLKPEKTTDYEIEFEQRLTRSSAFSISAFYKELRDQIEITYIPYAYPTDYTIYGNLDFGTVKGLTFSYDLRRTGNIRVNASYTLQFANGTGSGTGSQARIANNAGTNLRELMPLDFDQRHNIVTTIDYHYASGKDYDGPILFNKQIFANTGLDFVFRTSSGRPYTRIANAISYTGNNVAAYRLLGTPNGSRRPWNFRIDAKLDKSFDVTGKKASGESRRPVSVNIYVQVQNLLDTRNVLSVYQYTGSPTDDGYLGSATYQGAINAALDPQALRDMYTVSELNPSNYSLPRRIRLGVQVNF